jgi:hypothetical protein
VKIYLLGFIEELETSMLIKANEKMRAEASRLWLEGFLF